ncbi:MAG: HEAT repeat domain-containing protein [Myxococcaceae bacterium]|nr:HEAT repeat domain-containing protein [Myxococcaceae bacterium]
MRSAVLVVLVALSAGAQPRPRPKGAPPAPTAPAPVVNVDEAVRSLLSGYEYVPSKADFERLGPTAYPAVLAVVNDAKALTSTRLRAVAALSMVADPRAEAALEALVFDARAAVPMRAHATQALGARAGGRAVPVLERVLEDANPELREAAVRGLTASRLPPARGLLTTQQAKDPSPLVRDAAREGLERLGGK